MKQKLLFFLLIFPVLLLACNNSNEALPTPRPTKTPVPTPTPYPYQDASLSTDARVDDLLSRMTLREKVGQMTLIEKNSIEPNDVRDRMIGALLSGGGGFPTSNTPTGWARMVDTFQESALETRLQIPMLYGVDAVHGHSNVRGTVIFPHNVGLGATRNADLVREVGRVTALETAVTGIYWNYAPVLAVPQDIRWGRAYEGFGENTALVTELALAYFEGLQGADLGDVGTVLATPKHFVGDGGTTWGSSTTEDYRIDQGVMLVDEETLRAVHLAPYPPVIEAGAMSIMVSFSSWQETKMHAHRYLLTDVLKGELGFAGFLVSDWQGIDQINPNRLYDSIVTAVNAGVDMNMVPYDFDQFIKVMEAAVANGDIAEARIDDAVRRILTVKFELGLFERPFSDAVSLPDAGSDEHRAVAREAVRQSLVLLKNDNQALPIAKETPLIYVSGQGADDIGLQSGGWTINWQGGEGEITAGTTILEGIDAIVDGAEVRTTNFSDAMAEVGIVVVGERPYAEGVGDSNNLRLSAADIANIERMGTQAEQVVVVVLSGRPLIITDQLALADAWVAAWLPGSEGNGVADVLFGDYEFVGKLPYTWPRNMDQLPFDFDNLPSDGCDAPLFPYGFGLKTTDVATMESCE